MSTVVRHAPAILLFALASLAALIAGTVDGTWARAALIVGILAAAVVGAARAARLQPVNELAPERAGDAEPSETIMALVRDGRRPIVDRESGLYVDWYLRLRIEEEIARAARFGQRFSVVRVPLPAGARAAAATMLRRSLRHVDYAGELGDTLAVVLPNTTVEGAHTWRERFREVVPDTARMSEYPRDGQSVAALLGEEQWATGAPDPVAA